MTKNPSPAPEEDFSARAIEEQAAMWFGRCEIGLTPEQEREFLRWLEADARHGEAMREMDETWEYLDRIKESPRLRARAAPRRVLRFAPLFLAAAAAIAIAFVGFRHPHAPAPLVQHASTGADGMKQLELPDGSVVHLNADSAVEMRFTPGERRVQLHRGEAHFAVAKDPARPFVVVAGEVAVKAVGTAFNVRRAVQGVEVLVVEGKVRVDDAAQSASAPARPAPPAVTEPVAPAPALLVAGQRAHVPATTPGATTAPRIQVAPIEPAEIREALAWQVRQLDFDQKPLVEVAAEFNRHNSHQLVIADAQLAQQPFGGTFRADNYRVFVQLLEERFGVIAERGPEKTVLRRGNR